jgi:hypothetical protein
LSFLTKFFIVLHVVLTMLVVSGLVVFVNRVEKFNETGKQKDLAIAAAQRDASTAKAELTTLRTSGEATRLQLTGEIGRARQAANAAQAEVRKRDADLAVAQQNQASADARLQAATAALATAQQTVATLQQQINETRAASDKTMGQNTELLTANSDLNNRLQIALRQLANANEELENVKTELAGVQDRGGAPAPTDGGTDVAGKAPNTALDINGVVRDRRDINGVNYATISVGARDNVTKGMRFNVIDRQGGGNWLGYLVVDRVEDREATGRLEGPGVDNVKPGTEVRTQL